MIKVTNLTKIYKSKKKGKHKALDNVSFTLPNKGIVFVLGKSGSGKSTLLNLLGGLDSASSGNICVDGNDISSLRESSFANYRNTHIGFIFQDYHLLDELTVYENIVLSLNLRREEDKDFRVLKALERVGLKGYENRYPDELSGGERQRVAIARAIVKKPRIILADEPTGNLDNNTGSQIVKLLKELSGECLIVVVSHNLGDASLYADRIIELQKGRVIADLIHNPNFNDNLSINGDEIIYPGEKVLTKEDISTLNKELNKGHIRKIKRVYDKFIPIKDTNIKEEKHDIINKNLSKKNTTKLTFSFLKSKVLTILLSSLMASAIMIVFALAGSFVTFDSSKVIEEELTEMNVSSISADKGLDEETLLEVGDKYRVEIGKDDVLAFDKLGIKDEIYEVNNFTIAISNRNNQAGFKQTDFVNTPFLRESLGTIIASEDLIKQKYGKVEYIALADEAALSGVYISDYIADCVLALNSKYKGCTYQDLVGPYLYSNITLGYINGIYNTNYKTRYASLIADVLSGHSFEYKELFERQDFIELTSEIYSLSGFNLSYNPNFKEDYIKEKHTTVAWISLAEFNGVEYSNSSNCHINTKSSQKTYKELGDNDFVMSYTMYNNLFGTEYTNSTLKTFEGHKLRIKQYHRYDINKEHPIFDEEVNLVGLINTSCYGYAGDALFERLLSVCYYDYGLFFNTNEHISEIIDICSSLNYEQNLIIVTGIHTMTEVVTVFGPIFIIIAVVLFVAVILVITSFATKMIKVKMHDIGVLKALGSKNRTIVTIFGIQVLLVAILTTMFTIIGYAVLAGLTNDLLLSSLAKLASSRVFFDMQFVSFNGLIVGLTTIITFVLSFISLLLPMIRIRKIKPVKIIKTKE